MDSPLVFWAKLGNHEWPEHYHPVLCHLIDIAAVTKNLWDAAFHSWIQRWVAERLGVNEDACSHWLAFWTGAHDIGKVSPGFQAQGKTDKLKKRLQPSFNFDPAGGKTPHGDVSTIVLASVLTEGRDWPPVPPRVARNIAVAVGGHHGFFPTNWDDICSPLGNEKWAAARRAMLAHLARLCGVTNLPSPHSTSPDDQSVWMYVAGLTSVADWIGSNQEFFKPVGDAALVDGPFDVDEYFKKANARAIEALERLGWLRAGATAAPITFAELFRFIQTPRPLQAAVAEIVATKKEPSLLIVEAPMGEGKTEAGWYAAACWARSGGQGAYVALPTMATSNQMFQRVGLFLEADSGGNLMLLHGKAALNDQFEKLKYAALLYDQEDKPASAVVAEGWFAANKKHGLLAPYGVGTIDQALLAVLQTKHVFVRLFGLAGKCIILDEVHAYDAYMTTLMAQLLRWLAALGCPVVLLSATLPRDKRLRLLQAYAGEDLPEPIAVQYPRVTTTTIGGRADVRHVEADPARARTIYLEWLGEERLAERLRGALANGGCAAVIRNTVGLTQKAYCALKNYFANELGSGELRLDLFHARFPFGRRKQIEDDVLRWYGRTKDDVMRDGRIVSAPHRPRKSILVASQVVEQSLDLDFDLIASDLAPVDLTLQRAGRMWRHYRNRPPGMTGPRLWLIEPEVRAEVPCFGASEFVYARFVLLRSHLALKAVQAILLPDDLERFIEQVYGAEALAVPNGWQAALDDSERELREKETSQQLNAVDVAINDPDQSPLEQQSQQLEEDDPEAAKKIQALTRDADPTIQLVVIYHFEGQDYLDPARLEPFDEAQVPDLRRVRRLLDNEVTISHRGCFAFYAGRSVPKGWRKKGMLRHHRITRVDGAGKSLPGDFALRVDHELGVRFTED
jgi:CRISPR-associated endonuclease/helicase Cas3